MEEQTTTDASVQAATGGEINGIPVDDQGMAVAAPEPSDSTDATAESEPNASEPDEDTSVTEVSSETTSNWDDDVREWAEKKGLDLDNPQDVSKALKSYREAEKTLHKTSQEKSTLEKRISSGEFTAPVDDSEAASLRSEIAQIKLENQVNTFWAQNPEAKEFEPAMVEILQDRPHLANDIEALYALARVNSGTDKVSGGREALEKLASKQKAAAVTGNATTSAPTKSDKITPQNVDQWVATHSHEEFVKHYDEINKAMAG